MLTTPLWYLPCNFQLLGVQIFFLRNHSSVIRSCLNIILSSHLIIHQCIFLCQQICLVRQNPVLTACPWCRHEKDRKYLSTETVSHGFITSLPQRPYSDTISCLHPALQKVQCVPCESDVCFGKFVLLVLSSGLGILLTSRKAPLRREKGFFFWGDTALKANLHTDLSSRALRALDRGSQILLSFP